MKEQTAKLIGKTLLRFLVIGAILETTWTIYIAVILPRQYSANHWDLAWVGLDIAQVSMLIGAAWAAWRQRAILVLFATACATLLVVDAWFDVTTARQGGVTQSILLAGIVEIPSALLLLWLAYRSLHHKPLLSTDEEAKTPPPRVTDPLPPIQ